MLRQVLLWMGGNMSHAGLCSVPLRAILSTP